MFRVAAVKCRKTNGKNVSLTEKLAQMSVRTCKQSMTLAHVQPEYCSGRAGTRGVTIGGAAGVVAPGPVGIGGP